jgi:cell division protein FtsL
MEDYINMRKTNKYPILLIITIISILIVSCSSVDDKGYDYASEITAMNEHIIEMRATIEHLDSTIIVRDSIINDLTSQLNTLESKVDKINKTLSIIKMKMSIMEVDKF